MEQMPASEDNPSSTVQSSQRSDVMSADWVAGRYQALAKAIGRIRQSLDLDTIFQTTVAEVRQLLRADRVGVFRFYPEQNWEGEFIVEDVAEGWDSTVTMKVHDRCFSERFAPLYLQGRVTAIADIQQEDFAPCYLKILGQFQIRANMIAPLLKGQRLWGLLCLHQCSGPRQWQATEIEFIQQIADHLSVALEHNHVLVQAQQQAAQQKALNRVIGRIRESLDLNAIFKTTAAEVRQLLQVDRVAVFRFYLEQDWEGEFVAEDVADPWRSVLTDKVYDYCFGERFAPLYEYGQVQAVADIYAAGLSDCHVEILSRFQVRANLIVPLLLNDRLWGLLCLHQCSTSRTWQPIEIGFACHIASQLGVALKQDEYLQQARRQAARLAEASERNKTMERQQLLATTIDRIRQSLEIETVFQTTTQAVRQLLKVERVVIYRFNSDWSGTFVAESIAQGWASLLDPPRTIKDSFLQDNQGGRYRNHETTAVSNIYAAGHSHCHIELLEEFEAKAYAIAPIFQGERLWGLLAAYQNSAPRHWHPDEVELLAQVGVQLGIALQQAEALKQLQHQRTQLQQANERQYALARTIKEIRQSLDIQTIFQTAAREVRKLLDVERVVIYRFNPDWSGTFVAEAVATGWSSLLQMQAQESAQLNRTLADNNCVVRTWEDTCVPNEDTYLQDTQGGAYSRGVDYLCVEDIYTTEFSACYIDFLEKFQTRAYLTVPIFQGSKLWGLLASYQNSGPRRWADAEIDIAIQIGNQLGVALQQAELLAQTQQQTIELQAAKDVAERASQAKSRFLSTMSHELRTPLNAILGFTEMMTDEPSLNPTQQEQLDIINRSGEHLLALIDDVLEMATIEAGQVSLQECAFDLHELLHNLEAMLQLKAQSKGLQLNLAIAPDVPKSIRADESKLRQILINLLGNAIKFTTTGSVTLSITRSPRTAREQTKRDGQNAGPQPTPRPVRTASSQNQPAASHRSRTRSNNSNAVRTASSAESPLPIHNEPLPIPLKFEVKDTGSGIAADELETLFAPFVQTQTGQQAKEGTGLGLPISQEFVRLMGGEIDVSSAVGQGTTFWFEIPVGLVQTVESQPISLPRRVVGLAPNQPAYRIMVVEDDRASRLLLMNILKPLGLQVREADNGEAAIALWETWQPHLIWMDIQMPRLDGYEAIKQIRAKMQATAPPLDPTTPDDTSPIPKIIALTASAFEEDRAAILAIGGDDFASKPFKRQIIFDKMAQHLGLVYRYE